MNCLTDALTQILDCIGASFRYTRVGTPSYDTATGVAAASTTTLTVRGFWASARTLFQRRVRKGNQMLVVLAAPFSGKYPIPGDLVTSDADPRTWRVVDVQEDVPGAPLYGLEVERV